MADMRRHGIGIGLIPGAHPTYWINPSGQSVLNQDVTPFDQDGNFAPGESRRGAKYATRFLGGDVALANLLPNPNLAAENAFMVGTRVLHAARKFGGGTPSFEGLPFQWLPGEWDGSPSDEEILTFSFCARPTDDFVRRWYKASTFKAPDPSKLPGMTPENPMPVVARFDAGRRPEGGHYRFFTDVSVGGQGAGERHVLYFRHVTETGGPEHDCHGYEPGPDGYPAVFGPDLPPPEPEPEPEPEPNHLREIKNQATKARILLRDKGTQTSGGGAYARELRELLKVIGAVLLPCLLPLLLGCSALKPLWPGGVTAADAEWDGVKLAQAIPVSSQLDPRASAVSSILQLLGQEDPLGVLLPLTPIGATQPRWVLCERKLAAKCLAIPLNAEVHFAGSAVGPGLVWLAKDLSARHFND